jgi:HK97 family phage major capsid protein
MTTVAELKDRVLVGTRAAQNLLADKGSSKWTPRDQSTFDQHMDDVERAQEALDAVLAATGQTGVIFARQREAVELFARKDHRDMTDAEQRLIRNTISTDTTGGYLVPSLVAGDIVSVLKEFQGMRQVCGQFTTDGRAPLGYPSSDGTSEYGEMSAENATASSMDPTFATASMRAFKFGSKVITAPIELVEDAQFDIVAFIEQRAIERIGRIQNKKFTIGVGGTTEPTGVVTAASVGKIGLTGQTLTVIYEDLVDLSESVDVGHGKPSWMFSQTTRSIIRRIKDTAGRPIWTPSFVDAGGPESSSPAQLLGCPVQINNEMPSPAASAKSIAFGNFKHYKVRDVAQVILRRFGLEDSGYSTRGQIGFLMWAFAGGNLTDTGAIKLYQHSAT